VNPAENLEKALALYDRARVEGFEKNTLDYATALMNEGNARGALAELGVNTIDNVNKAESLFLEAKAIFSQANAVISLINVNKSAGYLKYSTNEMPEAYDYLREAIELIEEMRASIKMPELRKEYFETVVAIYKNMVFTCLALGKDKNEEAFRYTESAKGRTFLEVLASEKKRIKGDSELIKKYKDVLRKIDEIEATLRSGKERGIGLEEEFQRLKGLHDDLLREIKQSDPEYYNIKTVEPISLDKLSGILKGRTLVEYFIGYKLAIFVVNGNLTVVEKEINEKELSEKVSEFRELVSKLEGHLKDGTKPDETEESEKAEKILTDFYKLLIEPIKGHLSEEIVIVPHGLLHLIPFQALKGDRYLIEDYKVCFAQSASSLEFLKEGAGKGTLIVGNPTKDLRFAEIEAKEVAEIFNTSPIIGDGAKKDRVMEEMKNKEILHFSCHGLFDPYNPAFSRLILSDGSITARDFMDLEMDANLTVLSACETALAKVARGDEVEGLVRAIQYGGCRFVIASLWKVEDRSTKELFLKFYNTKGGAIVDRIREAELSLMKEYGFYFWAPFQVYGIESG
jgi:CHAT domain-containing protein